MTGEPPLRSTRRATDPWTRAARDLPLRDRTPFSRGEKVGFGIATVLWCAVLLMPLWGHREEKACVAAAGSSGLCGSEGVFWVLVAIVIFPVGLAVFILTARRRGRRLRRIRSAHDLPLSDLTPLSKGEKVGYGLVTVLWCAVPLPLFWGYRGTRECFADSDWDLCVLAFFFGALVAIVIFTVGLAVLIVTALLRKRRLGRIRERSDTDGVRATAKR